MSSQPCPCPAWCQMHLRATGPGGLRAGATALPALAAIAGYLLPRSSRAGKAARIGAVSLPVGAVAMVLAARALPAGGRLGSSPGATRQPGQPDDREALAPDGPLVTVVVPARDEAAVIGRLIADLGAARSDPMAVVVVDDASCDGMAAVASAAIERSGLRDAARVIRLATPSGSKGAALAAVPVPAEGVVAVLDADARVGPDFIARVRSAGRMATVAQARRRMLRPVGWRSGPGARLLALLQDGEQEVDGLIARARQSVGGATEFRGDGMLIRADALAALGGWPSDALCEDLELATRWYVATGLGVERPAGLEVWEQPVLAVRPLLRQRLRWAEGSIRRDLRLVLPALLDRRRPTRRRAELAVYASQALAPWAALGMAVQAARPSGGQQSAERRATRTTARRTLAAVASGYGLAALLLAWGSQRRTAGDAHRDRGSSPDGLSQLDREVRPDAVSRAESAADGVAAGRRPAGTPLRRYRTSAQRQLGRLARAGAVTAFTGLWAVVLPVAWLRVAVRPASPEFVKTPHQAPARFIEPG